MAKTRDNYQVQANSLQELILGLNLLLQRLADRMDKIEGIRGTASIESDLNMNMNYITDITGAINTDEAVSKAQLPDQGLSSTDSPTFVGLTVSGNTLLSGDLTVGGTTNMVALALTGALNAVNAVLTGNLTAVDANLSGNLAAVNLDTTGNYRYEDGTGTLIHAFATSV